ncbi:MAG: 50S ribosomal protein L15 [Chloroflexi bacterium]|nr:50S ribosomal protein L15 [Chloroflexota bacterium]
MVRAYDLKAPPGARKSRKRIGRGNGSRGTYSGRGMKGQKARSGRGIKPWFEGGQTKIIKRLPEQRGFTNIFRIEYATVNVSKLAVFAANTEVDGAALVAAGILKNVRKPIKILGDGELTVALTVRADKFTGTAKTKIEAAGGTAQEIEGA